MVVKDYNKLRAREGPIRFFLQIWAMQKAWDGFLELLSMMGAMLMAVSVAYGIYI